MTFLIGILAQILFAARTLVQWLATERKKSVQNPLSFWIISLVASMMMLVYGVMRDDIVIIAGQIVCFYIYVVNIQLKRVIPSWGAVLTGTFPLILLAYILVAGIHINLSFRGEQTGELSFLILFGMVAQAIWSSRMLYQVLFSLYRNNSELPKGFWILGLVGCAGLLVYGIMRVDIPFSIGQAFALIPIVRNLKFINNDNKHKI